MSETPERNVGDLSGQPAASSPWPKRLGVGLIGIVVIAIAWAFAPPDGDGDEARTDALWSTLGVAIDDADYDAFLACFTPENQEKLGTDGSARRRFTYAVDDLAELELRMAETSGNPEEGRLRVQIIGSALPAAIGMPADPATGLLVDVVRTDDGWVIADARPSDPMAQPGGDPVERAANRAVLGLTSTDLLARVLNEAEVATLSREQRFALSQWMDEVRESGMPPEMEFGLDPTRFDAEAEVWEVDVVLRGLADKLAAPDARLVLVLGPMAQGRSTPDRSTPDRSTPDRSTPDRSTPGDDAGPRWRIIESRLTLR